MTEKRKTKTIADGRKVGSGKPKGRVSGPRSKDSIMLEMFGMGESFYTEKKDKDMTALAVFYGVKITTERLLAIHPIKQTITQITKVTIV